MKPQQTVPVIASAAPILAAAPPILIVAAIGLGLYWLFSNGGKRENTPEAVNLSTDKGTSSAAVAGNASAPKRITREDVADALAYGAKRLTRKEAVVALEALGFRKTSAYKALAEDGKLASLIEFASDGLIEWKG